LEKSEKTLPIREKPTDSSKPVSSPHHGLSESSKPSQPPYPPVADTLTRVLSAQDTKLQSTISSVQRGSSEGLKPSPRSIDSKLASSTKTNSPAFARHNV